MIVSILVLGVTNIILAVVVVVVVVVVASRVALPIENDGNAFKDSIPSGDLLPRSLLDISRFHGRREINGKNNMRLVVVVVLLRCTRAVVTATLHEVVVVVVVALCVDTRCAGLGFDRHHRGAVGVGVVVVGCVVRSSHGIPKGFGFRFHSAGSLTDFGTTGVVFIDGLSTATSVVVGWRRFIATLLLLVLLWRMNLLMLPR